MLYHVFYFVKKKNKTGFPLKVARWERFSSLLHIHDHLLVWGHLLLSALNSIIISLMKSWFWMLCSHYRSTKISQDVLKPVWKHFSVTWKLISNVSVCVKSDYVCFFLYGLAHKWYLDPLILSFFLQMFYCRKSAGFGCWVRGSYGWMREEI